MPPKTATTRKRGTKATPAAKAKAAPSAKAKVAAAKKAKPAPSLVGQYAIRCAEIEQEWPDQAVEMSLSIKETETPGLFEAVFDFGILEGVMRLSADEEALRPFDSDSFWGRQSEGEPAAPARKPRKGGATTLFLRLRCKETDGGHTYPVPANGSITFNRSDCASFSGTADLPAAGESTPFTGRKMSNTPQTLWSSWEDYALKGSGRF